MSRMTHAVVTLSLGAWLAATASAQSCTTVSDPDVSLCTASGVPSGTCRYNIAELSNYTATRGPRTCSTFCNSINMDCGGMYSTAASYEQVSAHIGCHASQCGGNCGYIGRPMNFLPNHNQVCRYNNAQCVALGVAACDYMTQNGQQCWGFAVHNGWGVQVYSSNASQAGAGYSSCNGRYGLTPNGAWDTYRRTSGPCNPPSSATRYHCDFAGFADEESWTCDCMPRTPSPTAPPTDATTTRITTVTTHTMFQDSNRSIRILQAENNNQTAQIGQLTGQVSTLTATVSVLQSTLTTVSATTAAHAALFASVTQAIGQALSFVPDMAPPQGAIPPCSGVNCQPSVMSSDNNSLLINAQSRVLVQTSQCSVDPCELREQVRGVIQAISALNP